MGKRVVVICEDLTGVASVDLTFTARFEDEPSEPIDIETWTDEQINEALDREGEGTGFGASAARAFADLAHKKQMSVKALEKATTVVRTAVR